MVLVTEYAEGCRKTLGAEVIECIEGCYEALEVPYGVVYRWYPGSLLIECGCGKRQVLTCSSSTCSQCDADHASVVREELAALCSEDTVLHPWRYWRPKGAGIPF